MFISLLAVLALWAAAVSSELRQGFDGLYFQQQMDAMKLMAHSPFTGVGTEKKIPYKMSAQKPYPVYVYKPFPVVYKRPTPYIYKVLVSQPYGPPKKAALPYRTTYPQKNVFYNFQKPAEKPYSFYVPVAYQVESPVQAEKPQVQAVEAVEAIQAEVAEGYVPGRPRPEEVGGGEEAFTPSAPAESLSGSMVDQGWRPINTEAPAGGGTLAPRPPLEFGQKIAVLKEAPNARIYEGEVRTPRSKRDFDCDYLGCPRHN